MKALSLLSTISWITILYIRQIIYIVYISVVLLLVAFSRCFFKYLHFVLIFATLLWFFQRENLGAFVVSHYISNQNQLFFFKNQNKAGKKQNKLEIFEKKQWENAMSNSNTLHLSISPLYFIESLYHINANIQRICDSFSDMEKKYNY